MAQNDRTPATGMARALENVFVGTIDNSRDTASASHLQARRIASRFKVSPALAAVLAGLAFSTAEDWKART